MPNLSNLSHFIQDKLELVIFYLGILVLGQVKINLQFCTSYLVIIMNSHVMWKTVRILISWLLQKLDELDLHCFNSLRLVSYCFKGDYT